MISLGPEANAVDNVEGQEIDNATHGALNTNDQFQITKASDKDDGEIDDRCITFDGCEKCKKSLGLA